ncbi:DNA mismatch repair endonuclease MutL [[Clostridium] fimetarium]|uniref:DNA mismatch repair protein MutL n=1 Tax=[Clostridium] fimetarium TaxID=99656 RepID=A0A1I0QJ71_9FIRM|nr:DNA mismatch repair endonuclease MutL [[Clostridium] fimetarium]SEW27239.1 DNA mismatch repair protein MutL [[Clostridium] fimetarium]
MGIQVLDQDTINQIAAGEVIERPASIVKELIENAIDAKATAVTVEIKDGGISFVRITDNGCGIQSKELQLAFLRHCTSKIKSIEDLAVVSSLGFRGEALSSIAAVAQVELITKTKESFSGSRYVIEGGKEISLEEVGAPEGTTFIVRNLFYNTPVRRKFLKSASTEAGYIDSLIEHLALSHPDVSFRFINNNQNKLHTSGNTNLRDIIYHVYGREISANLLNVKDKTQDIEIEGFIGKPVISRGNRSYENYYINGRYIKSSVISRAIEEAYKGFIMMHKYPFTAMHFKINPEIIDVNVHPTKMELRFSHNEFVYEFVLNAVRKALTNRELIPNVEFKNSKRSDFIINSNEATVSNLADSNAMISNTNISSVNGSNTTASNTADSNAMISNTNISSVNGSNTTASNTIGSNPTGLNTNFSDPTGSDTDGSSTDTLNVDRKTQNKSCNKPVCNSYVQSEPDSYNTCDSQINSIEINNTEIKPENNSIIEVARKPMERLPEPFEIRRSEELLKEDNIASDYGKKSEQIQLFPDDLLLDKQNRNRIKVVGQLFDTYWLIEFEDKLFIMDQHAAHEKILFEKTMNLLKDKQMDSQMLNPPIILSLNMREEQLLNEHIEIFVKLGYEIESFGGKEYKVIGIPANLPTIDDKGLLIEILDGLVDENLTRNPDAIIEKVASMSCKAAVKGNSKLSALEAKALIDELLEADNPYNCPHGRPTLISMTKYEIEKKFKRIV